jgi:hypothetical protein
VSFYSADELGVSPSARHAASDEAPVSRECTLRVSEAVEELRRETRQSVTVARVFALLEALQRLGVLSFRYDADAAADDDGLTLALALALAPSGSAADGAATLVCDDLRRLTRWIAAQATRLSQVCRLQAQRVRAMYAAARVLATDGGSDGDAADDAAAAEATQRFLARLIEDPFAAAAAEDTDDVDGATRSRVEQLVAQCRAAVSPAALGFVSLADSAATQDAVRCAAQLLRRDACLTQPVAQLTRHCVDLVSQALAAAAAVPVDASSAAEQRAAVSRHVAQCSKQCRALQMAKILQGCFPSTSQAPPTAAESSSSSSASLQRPSQAAALLGDSRYWSSAEGAYREVTGHFRDVDFDELLDFVLKHCD